MRSNTSFNHQFELRSILPLNTMTALVSVILSTLFLSALLIALLVPRAWAAEKTVYVSDEFTVPLRSGASNRHRIRLNLKTGTRLTLLNRDSDTGFTQVKTERGTEGWILSQHLVNNPIARTRLLQANSTLEKTKQQLTTVKSTSSQTHSKLGEVQQQLKSLSRQNQSLTSELTSIKKISANALNLDHNNRELLQNNELLKIQIAELQADNSRLADKSDQEWFIRGAFAVAIGALLTVVLPRLKPRTRSREWG